MKQDEFEKLHKLISEMEAAAKTQADERMFDGIRAGVGVLERLVVALERIAANTTPMVITKAAPAPNLSTFTTMNLNEPRG